MTESTRLHKATKSSRRWCYF